MKPNNDGGVKKKVADKINPIPAAGKIRIPVASVLEIKKNVQKHDRDCADDANYADNFKATAKNIHGFAIVVEVDADGKHGKSAPDEASQANLKVDFDSDNDVVVEIPYHERNGEFPSEVVDPERFLHFIDLGPARVHLIRKVNEVASPRVRVNERRRDRTVFKLPFLVWTERADVKPVASNTANVDVSFKF